MVVRNTSTCPDCGGNLKHYDKVFRTIRTKGRRTNQVRIRRLRCSNCRVLHREIPNDIYPHKQYESEIIDGVVEGYITSETVGFEDYPCEATMNRWRLNEQFLEEIAFLF